ncbi:hypothetical protein IC803_00025 [Geobacillus sp. 46C-IIa]|nr:hypothetical protein [Geobacillus sp. 46C-IIa]QNU29780.1 hypothetical protein IC803_00025 [Geobacillus sp. 46C-IIa]
MDEEKDLAQRKKKQPSGRNSWRVNGWPPSGRPNRPSRPLTTAALQTAI